MPNPIKWYCQLLGWSKDIKYPQGSERREECCDQLVMSGSITLQAVLICFELCPYKPIASVSGVKLVKLDLKSFQKIII